MARRRMLAFVTLLALELCRASNPSQLGAQLVSQPDSNQATISEADMKQGLLEQVSTSVSTDSNTSTVDQSVEPLHGDSQALVQQSGAAYLPDDKDSKAARQQTMLNVLKRKHLREREHPHAKRKEVTAAGERMVEVGNIQAVEPGLANEHEHWSLLNFELGALALLMLALPVVYWRKMRTRHL